MGKTSKPKSPNTKGVAPAITPEVQGKVNDLRAEAAAQFLKKDFAKAADAFSQAVQLLPDGDIKAELLQKKVGCLISLKRYKEAVREASSVLQLSPNSTGALKSRARAYEHLGQYKQALADVQAVNRTDAATEDTRIMEKRIKDAMSGRGPSRPGSGSSSRNNPLSPTITIKATYGNESKLIYVGLNLSYAELLELVREKFPNAGPFLIRYTDKDGDQVTITSRQDIQVALSELVAAFHRQLQGAHSPKLQQQALPALKLAVVPVASEADVPRPPIMELAERAGTAARLTMQESTAQAAAAASPAQQPQAFEGEEWIMDFVRLFTDVTGIDPAAHVIHHQEGQEKLQRAMMDTMQAEGAEELLEQAADNFRDAVVNSYIQWGNVFLVKADRAMHALKKARDADPSKQWDGAPELQCALKMYDLTEAKIREGLAINADSWDALCALGQVEWERAKAKMGFVLDPAALLTEEQSAGKTPEQVAAEQHAASLKQLEQVLSTISKEAVEKVTPHIEKFNDYFNQAETLARQAWRVRKQRDAVRAAQDAAHKAAAEEQRKNRDEDVDKQAEEAAANGNAVVKKEEPAQVKKEEPAQVRKEEPAQVNKEEPVQVKKEEPEVKAEPGVVKQEAAEEKPAVDEDEKLPLSSPPSHVLINHGNIMYELSQVYAVTGAQPWRPLLDAAAVKFRASGAAEVDVRNALKNHLRKDELDLGPDPEPEVPATSAAPGAAPAASSGSVPAPATPAPSAGTMVSPSTTTSTTSGATPGATASTASSHPVESAKAKGLPSLEVKKAKK